MMALHLWRLSLLKVTSGFQTGQLVLPLPSLRVLAEAAMSGVSRRGVVVHILESCVVAWMKQVKVNITHHTHCLTHRRSISIM